MPNYTFILSAMGANEWRDSVPLPSDEAAHEYARKALEKHAEGEATATSVAIGKGDDPEHLEFLGAYDREPSGALVWFPDS